MLQMCPTISVTARSLLPFIEEFVRQGLISQISIMLVLKNSSIVEWGKIYAKEF